MHSRPTVGLANRGDQARVVVAYGAFINALADDPRVMRAYFEWRIDRRIDPLIDRMRANPTDANIATMVRAVASPATPTEIEQVAGVLRAAGVTQACVARALITHFKIATYNVINPQDRRGFQLSAPALSGLPKGRQPRNDGGDIARNVVWYYRNRIKDPPDLADITREYTEQQSRHTEAHSVVQNGIAQAEALLALIID